MAQLRACPASGWGAGRSPVYRARRSPQATIARGRPPETVPRSRSPATAQPRSPLTPLRSDPRGTLPPWRGTGAAKGRPSCGRPWGGGPRCGSCSRAEPHPAPAATRPRSTGEAGVSCARALRPGLASAASGEGSVADDLRAVRLPPPAVRVSHGRGAGGGFDLLGGGACDPALRPVPAVAHRGSGAAPVPIQPARPTAPNLCRFGRARPLPATCALRRCARGRARNYAL